MTEPIWWMRVVLGGRLFLRGESYYALPRWQAGMSWWIAGVIADTCRAIRVERATP